MSSSWFRLPDYATVFQAEITAISKAAEELMKLRSDRMRYVKIFVDSQAAIAAVGNPRVTSVAVAKAIDDLNKLAEKVTSVTIVWIPAHKGHEGNERADVLAKRGSEETSIQRRVAIGKPNAEIKAAIRKLSREEWSGEWRAHKIANHSKGFYGGPNPSKARFVYKLARLELGRFARIITGHNNLNFFQHKIGLYSTPICRFCGEGDETITHFLHACPRLLAARREIFLLTSPTSDMKWSVRDLLDFSYVPGINEAYEGSQANQDGPMNGGVDDVEEMVPGWLGT